MFRFYHLVPVSYTHLDVYKRQAELREVTAYDELELDTLGDRKTALFLIMSDTDDSFNFLIRCV